MRVYMELLIYVFIINLKVPNQHFVNLRFRKIKNIDYKLTCIRPYFFLVLPSLDTILIIPANLCIKQYLGVSLLFPKAALVLQSSNLQIRGMV